MLNYLQNLCLQNVCRIEVESTNYENSKEDVKNNQTEDKIECKESLKVGYVIIKELII